MLAKEPSERHAHHAGLIAEILRAREAVVAGAPSLRQLRRRRGFIWAATTALILIGGGAAFWQFYTRTKPAVAPQVLSGLEMRVARLAAAGRSDPEVAAALGVSLETVEVHLSTICRKLGARSRPELIGLLARDRRPTTAARAAPPDGDAR